MKNSLFRLIGTIALTWVATVEPLWAASSHTRHYKVTFHATSGTFGGQDYPGSFDVDQSGLTGIGTEVLPASTVDHFTVTMFGSKIVPVQGAAQPVFNDGNLVKIIGGFAAASVTEGSQLRGVGINTGFTDGQVPAELREGRWWGYLNPATIVDGFGTYDLELQPWIPTDYTILFHATSGTFNGQTYSGSFEVDTSSVTGVGTEILPLSTVSNLRVTMFGSKLGPLANAAQPVFVDGKLVKIIGGFGVPSASEGNRFRSVGINNGFSEGQIPANLRDGAWWGYLDPATFVDGFGPYEIIPKPILRHYRVTFRATSGTFSGQSYPGSFDVDVSQLRGIGTETLPLPTVTNLRVSMFGNEVGPLAGAAQPVFMDGKLVRILGGFGAASASEGNQLRSVGINIGFEEFQVPVDLRPGRWWGYLDPATFVDGFGPYDLEEAFDLEIFTAAEVEFATRIGRTYQIQSAMGVGSPAEQDWTNFEAPIPGTGAPISRLISIRGTSRKIFRVQETTP